jgi:hypothetical protein
MMKNFNDIWALQSVLKELYEKAPGDMKQRRLAFIRFLEQQLELNGGDALLYGSTVLTRNAEGSSDWVGFGALKVLGTWISMSQQGMAAALLTSQTETWRFSQDLMCEHVLERYEGYVSPFGSSYSRPASTREDFIWAPSDLSDPNLNVVIVPLSGGSARRLTFGWTDQELHPRKCSINGVAFVKQ